MFYDNTNLDGLKLYITSCITYGVNSRAMVVSIGIFPPILKPTNAARARSVVYEFDTPRQSPKTEDIKTVILNAHFRPTMSTRTPHAKAPAVSPEEKGGERLPVQPSSNPDSC